MNLIERMRQGVQFSNTTMVEIGPLYRPFVWKRECDVRYVDHADTATLREKYKDNGVFDVAEIVEVDGVWGDKTLQQALGEDFRADYLFASHVIEHVPDLLTWLGELRSVLKPDGEIRLVIPDKRFTFDYLRRETALQDVIDAHARRARRPLPANIFDHLNYTRHVDIGAAWAGPLDPAALPRHHSFEQAMEVVRDSLATTNYHDVHCWVFTPRSFTRLMREAAELGLTDLACHSFHDTLPGTLEFMAFLRKSDDKDAIRESWLKAEREATVRAPGESQSRLEFEDGRVRLQDLEHEVKALQARQSQLQEQLDAAKAEAAAYVASTSWRATKPLRKLMDLIRS